MGAELIKNTGFVLDLSKGVGYFKFDSNVLVSLSGTTVSDGVVLEVSEPHEQTEADPFAHPSPARRQTLGHSL